MKRVRLMASTDDFHIICNTVSAPFLDEPETGPSRTETPPKAILEALKRLQGYALFLGTVKDIPFIFIPCDLQGITEKQGIKIGTKLANLPILKKGTVLYNPGGDLYIAVPIETTTDVINALLEEINNAKVKEKGSEA